MTEQRAHAILSPSGADRWMTCLGSVALTKDLPDVENEYSIEGVDYHELAAVCLDEDTNAGDYIGRTLPKGTIVTEDNARYLQDGYITPVRAYAALGSLVIEQKAPIHHLTGEAGAEGTADAVIIPEAKELIVVDLKFGRGVEVDVVDNRQLKIYALGVIEKHGLNGLIEQVRLVICQPRAGEGKPKEWVIPIADLLAFGTSVKVLAERIMTATTELPLVPSEKACRFCKVRALCPALTKKVQNAMTEGFSKLLDPVKQVQAAAKVESPEDPNVALGRLMSLADLAEIWLKAVRAAVEMALLAGNEVPGFKLVAGKRGNRKWDDEKEVEDLMKGRFRMTIDEMYDLSVKSPTTMEKGFKKKHPRYWGVLEAHITQKEGVPSVAPVGDKRPAYVKEKPEEGFEKVDDGSDLI